VVPSVVIRATPDWWKLRIRVEDGERAWLLEPDSSRPRSQTARRSSGWRGVWPVVRVADGAGIGSVQCLDSNNGLAISYQNERFEVKGSDPFSWGGHTFRFPPRSGRLECDGREIARFRAVWTNVRATDPPKEYQEMVAILAGAKVLFGLVALPA
jgi:hypothetical protein